MGFSGPVRIKNAFPQGFGSVPQSHFKYQKITPIDRSASSQSIYVNRKNFNGWLSRYGGKYRVFPKKVRVKKMRLLPELGLLRSDPPFDHSWSKRLPHNLSCLVPCVRLLNPPMGANRNWATNIKEEMVSSLGTPFNSGMYPIIPRAIPSLLAPILDWQRLGRWGVRCCLYLQNAPAVGRAIIKFIRGGR